MGGEWRKDAILPKKKETKFERGTRRKLGESGEGTESFLTRFEEKGKKKKKVLMLASEDTRGTYTIEWEIGEKRRKKKGRGIIARRTECGSQWLGAMRKQSQAVMVHVQQTVVRRDWLCAPLNII